MFRPKFTYNYVMNETANEITLKMTKKSMLKAFAPSLVIFGLLTVVPAVVSYLDEKKQNKDEQDVYEHDLIDFASQR